MLSPRLTKALATGILLLASVALILFVASVFSRGGNHMRMSYLGSSQDELGREMSWVGKKGMRMMGEASGALVYQSPMTTVSDALPMMDKMMPSMNGSVVGMERKVATTASVDLRTKSLDWTVGKIREIAKNVGGFVESANINQPERGMKSAWVTVKVPADRFDTVMAEIKQTADQVINENTGSADMTAQHIDLTARINNKQAEEKAYENLLSTATKVTDVIEITGQLTNVRTEIESLEQSLRYLEGQTALATLSVSVTEDPQVEANSGEFQRGNVFKTSLNTLVDALLALGSGLVVFLISGLPILLIVLGLIWIVYRTARRVVGRMFGE